LWRAVDSKVLTTCPVPEGSQWNCSTKPSLLVDQCACKVSDDRPFLRVGHEFRPSPAKKERTGRLILTCLECKATGEKWVILNSNVPETMDLVMWYLERQRMNPTALLPDGPHRTGVSRIDAALVLLGHERKAFHQVYRVGGRAGSVIVTASPYAGQRPAWHKPMAGKVCATGTWTLVLSATHGSAMVNCTDCAQHDTFPSKRWREQIDMLAGQSSDELARAIDALVDIPPIAIDISDRKVLHTPEMQTALGPVLSQCLMEGEGLERVDKISQAAADGFQRCISHVANGSKMDVGMEVCRRFGMLANKHDMPKRMRTSEVRVGMGWSNQNNGSLLVTKVNELALGIATLQLGITIQMAQDLVEVKQQLQQLQAANQQCTQRIEALERRTCMPADAVATPVQLGIPGDAAASTVLLNEPSMDHDVAVVSAAREKYTIGWVDKVLLLHSTPCLPWITSTLVRFLPIPTEKGARKSFLQKYKRKLVKLAEPEGTYKDWCHLLDADAVEKTFGCVSITGSTAVYSVEAIRATLQADSEEKKPDKTATKKDKNQNSKNQKSTKKKKKKKKNKKNEEEEFAAAMKKLEEEDFGAYLDALVSSAGSSSLPSNPVGSSSSSSSSSSAAAAAEEAVASPDDLFGPSS
jgi:hypothetical protein